MKYQTGFVPVQFYKIGLVFIILGISGLVLRLLDYFFIWHLPNMILYASIALILVGLYLRRFAPKEESE